MTGHAGTPLTAKWQIIELDEAQGIGSVEIEDGFTLIFVTDVLTLDVNAVRRHQRNQRLAQTARRLRPEISHAPLPSHESATHRRPILWSQETINGAVNLTKAGRS